MPKKTPPVGRTAAIATQILGNLIAQHRRERGWTASQLSEAIGVSPRTVSHIERGFPSVAIGAFFEAASVLGVRLFNADTAEMARLQREGLDRLALLPERTRVRSRVIHNDF